ncbi:MAG: tRNA pseudouridine(38-40) synthase TruA [Planctomycetota bacterium]
MTLCRYKLTVAYDGSAFHGWQKQQPKDQPWPRTVEGELEQTLLRVLRQPPEAIGLLGASRTDTGVHAIGQVCHFNADTPIPLERLCKAINSRLPEDIDARHVEVVPPEFDAIRDATDKQYRYRILNAPFRPLGLRRLVYHEWSTLNLDAMRDAARRLVGTHDVEGFASAAHGRQTTIRTIHDCQIEAHPLPGGYATDISGGAGGRELHIVISGSGFLYNMVRIVAGTLIEIGLGKMPPERIDEILATKNRRLAGTTLPPNGLCLEWIRYAEKELTPRCQGAKTPRKAEGAGDGE